MQRTNIVQYSTGSDSPFPSLLNQPRMQRFIGVIYRKATEIPSHYSRCSVADQYDAVAILQNSRGIEPLEPEDTWKGANKGDYDATFPFGY